MTRRLLIIAALLALGALAYCGARQRLDSDAAYRAAKETTHAP